MYSSWKVLGMVKGNNAQIVSISLPHGVVKWLDKEMEDGMYFSRSGLIRRAIAFFKDFKDNEDIKKLTKKTVKFRIRDQHLEKQKTSENGEELYDFQSKMSYL